MVLPAAKISRIHTNSKHTVLNVILLVLKYTPKTFSKLLNYIHFHFPTLYKTMLIKKNDSLINRIVSLGFSPFK